GCRTTPPPGPLPEAERGRKPSAPPPRFGEGAGGRGFHPPARLLRIPAAEGTGTPQRIIATAQAIRPENPPLTPPLRPPCRTPRGTPADAPRAILSAGRVAAAPNAGTTGAAPHPRCSGRSAPPARPATRAGSG